MKTPSNPTAEKLVELCRTGRNLEAIDTLYSKDIVSVEACDSPGMERTMTGIDKIRGKNQWWFENHQIHGGSVKGPFMHGNDKFAVLFQTDATPKVGPMAGKRMQFEEIGVYTLQDGKIAREEFFYTMS